MKKICVLILTILSVICLAACTAVYEDRDKVVEETVDKYTVQLAAYDRLEKSFDFTDSVRAVESKSGHNRGTRFSSDDNTTSTLFHLNDQDEETVYTSAQYAQAEEKITVTADLQKSKFIDRIQFSPAKDAEGETYGFPVKFYVEVSNDMSNWVVVAARSEYPVPALPGPLFAGASESV